MSLSPSCRLGENPRCLGRTCWPMLPNGESSTLAAERVSGSEEPHPESPDQGSAVYSQQKKKPHWSEQPGQRGDQMDNKNGQIPHRRIVLLCYKRKTPQKGQRETCASSTRAIFIRRVVMEAGLCRSGRTRTARSEGRRDFGDW